MKIFTEDTDTEDEEFEGFTEGDLELNDWMKFMVRTISLKLYLYSWNHYESYSALFTKYENGIEANVDLAYLLHRFLYPVIFADIKSSCVHALFQSNFHLNQATLMGVLIFVGGCTAVLY